MRFYCSFCDADFRGPLSAKCPSCRSEVGGGNGYVSKVATQPRSSQPRFQPGFVVELYLSGRGAHLRMKDVDLQAMSAIEGQAPPRRF